MSTFSTIKFITATLAATTFTFDGMIGVTAIPTDGLARPHARPVAAPGLKLHKSLSTKAKEQMELLDAFVPFTPTENLSETLTEFVEPSANKAVATTMDDLEDEGFSFAGFCRFFMINSGHN
jgi:hypothetical protein